MYSYESMSSLNPTQVVDGNCSGNSCCINPGFYLTSTTQYECVARGTASITAFGGKSPYTYAWSNGGTGSIIRGLSAGTYSVTATDALGFKISKSDIVVTDNCTPVCTLTFRADVKGYCVNELGTIKVVVLSGRSPFNILWSSGASSGTGETIYTPKAGTYSITVTDGNNCRVVQNIDAIDACPINCTQYVDNCRAEWEEFIIKNYVSGKCKQWETACDLSSDIRRDGKVAIGYALTSVPSGFNLGVQGTVLAKDVKVRLCGMGEQWCDYVFDPTYKLMPLAEMSTYIKQNKRLPNMPSTSDIQKENGYELKKLTLLQQEKIEEAYLHLIKLEEKVKQLQVMVELKKQKNKTMIQLLKK
jgi:hypothetical protein